MAKSDRNTKIDAIAGGYLSADITQRFTERTFSIFSDGDKLTQLAEKWKNVAADKAQGHMFEQLEVIKFNFDALKKKIAICLLKQPLVWECLMTRLI